MEEISIGEFSRRSRLSIKALRLYDELGVLLPARVDRESGYRFYDVEQLDDARMIAMLRQLEVPLASIKELLACDRSEAATRIAAYWRDVEVAHGARRELADYLVNRLNGEELVMNVATREMPERSVLCLKRHVDEAGAWALGKEFIAIFRERPLPRVEGRESAMFAIFWGEVSADSDGPVEFCKPIRDANSEELAAQYPELEVRVDPAHREAYVPLSTDRNGVNPSSMQLASEALGAWALENGLERQKFNLTPEDLGVRMSYMAVGPITETSVPDCDFAIAFA